MGTTIIYAIGGTGAKILESLIHTCAAGLTAERLVLRLVDQDSSNGNGQRVRELIGDYKSIWHWLRNSNAPGQELHPLFRANIEGAERLLNVAADNTETLASAFNRGEGPNPNPSDDDYLMQALFTEEERSGRMLNGFRGQPAVGAAAFLSPRSRQQSPLWREIDADIRSAQMVEGDYRFLLLGSCFGGTGAAGVPTLANYLRNRLGSLTRVRIGAVLMLRYYDVSDRSAYGPATLARVRAAIEFYAQVMRPGANGSQSLFDSLYVVGLDPELKVPAEPMGGGPGQENPVLLPELIAALGAIHFFERRALATTASGNAAAQGGPIWLCGRASEGKVTWTDLPNAGATPEQDSRRLLCCFARFAICYAFGVHVGATLSQVPNISDDPMARGLLIGRDLEAGKYDSDAATLNRFVGNFLCWLGALHGKSGGSLALDIGHIGELVEKSTVGNRDLFRLRYDQTRLHTYGHGLTRTLEELFATFEIVSRARDFKTVMQGMAKPAPAGRRSRGLGTLVAALYQAAALPA